MNYRQFFKGKKITIMGLGLLGRGLGDAIFLAECGAKLIVTDLRDAKMLASSLVKLKRFKNIKYTLGEHKFGDFRQRDFIIKAAGVPLDSPFIAEARRHGIPIEMDASLFAKLMSKGVMIVGVTGTRGKSTTTALIYEILRAGLPSVSKEGTGGVVGVKGQSSNIKCSVYKGGNLVPEATLPLLEKVKDGDIVVLELDSWQLQGFHDAKISPHVAVFTTFLDDHLVYYKDDREKYFNDKTAIFKYQKKNDTLVIGEQVSSRFNLKSGNRLNLGSQTAIVARIDDVPADWKISLLGEHNRENIACAIAVARYFKIPENIVKKAIENFQPIPGRLEYLRTVRGVKIYNDNNATTPDATIAALKALSTKSEIRNPKQILNSKSKILNLKSIILIMGGTDKGLDMSKLVAEIPKHCKAVVFLEETGTKKLLVVYNAKHVMPDKESKKLHPSSRTEFVMWRGATRYTLHKTSVYEMETLKECVQKAMELARSGDTILFSPAFASFGKWFKNEYDRGEQFVRIVKVL